MRPPVLTILLCLLLAIGWSPIGAAQTTVGSGSTTFGSQMTYGTPTLGLTTTAAALGNGTIVMTARVWAPDNAAAHGHGLELTGNTPFEGISVTATRASCSRDELIVRCTTATLDPRTSAVVTVTFRAPADPAPGATSVYRASLIGSERSLIARNESRVALTASADLAGYGDTARTLEPYGGRPESGVWFGPYVYNWGPSTARNVFITASGNALHNMNASASYIPPECTLTPGRLTCSLGDIARFQTRGPWVFLVPTVNLGPSNGYISWSATSTSFDPNLGNNSRYFLFNANIGQPSLRMEFEGPSNATIIGEAMRFALRGTTDSRLDVTGYELHGYITGVPSVAMEGCVEEPSTRGIGFVCTGSGSLPFNATRLMKFTTTATDQTVAAYLEWGHFKGPGGEVRERDSFDLRGVYLVREAAPAAVEAAIAGPPLLHAGESATYEMTARNTGSGRSDPYVASIELAGPAKIVSAQGMGTYPGKRASALCALSATTVSCQLGIIPAGGVAAIKIVVLGLNGTEGEATLRLTPAASEGSATPLVVSVPPPEADLVFTSFTASNSQPRLNEAVSVSLSVRNLGGSRVRDAIVATDIPEGMDLEVDINGPCVRVDRRVTCFLGTVEPGGEERIEATVRASAVGSFEIPGRASSSAQDPDPINNARSLTVQVTAA